MSESTKMVKQAADSWATVRQLVKMTKNISPAAHQQAVEDVKRNARAAKEQIDSAPRPGNGVDADINELVKQLADFEDIADDTDESDL